MDIYELPRSRAAGYQKEFSFNPDAKYRGILLIKKTSTNLQYQNALAEKDGMLKRLRELGSS